MKNILIPALLLGTLISPSFVSAHDEPVACTMQYAPVCGTDNGKYRTYGNGCTLGAEHGIYQHEGECTAAELEGVSDGKTYTPPAHCVAWNDGCNSCARQGTGMAACTLMACMGEPRPGYCTAYAETGEVRPAPKPASPGTSTSSGERADSGISSEPADMAEATSTATTTEMRAGFFARLWTSIATWFGNLF